MTTPIVPPTVCNWTYSGDDYSTWETDCEQAFCIEDGTPEENKMKFCCYCGGTLVQVLPEPEIDEDE